MGCKRPGGQSRSANRAAKPLRIAEFQAIVVKQSTLLLNIGCSILLAVAAGWVSMPPSSYCQPAPASGKPAGAGGPREVAQAYSGRIIIRGRVYVLVNANDETTYELDDQRKARKYAGKNVIVIGNLNLRNKTIHVSEIRHNNA
jgi:hypothetical protein